MYKIYDYPFTDTDGTPLVLELGIDITKSKLLGQELHRSKKHDSTLAEVSPVGIFRTLETTHPSFVPPRCGFADGYQSLLLQSAARCLKGVSHF